MIRFGAPALLCSVLASPAALAQPAEQPERTAEVAPGAARITPPILRSSADVPYPEGASGATRVVLELVVEPDGTVSIVTVVSGAEPFAGYAEQAALAWTFEPARRDGVAVAARVRASVDFREPEADPGGITGRRASAPAPRARAATTATPVEVTVHGERREIGRTTISAAEVREMPGAFGDGFRAIEALPGVTPTQSGVPYFFVRGAPPNNNGYFLDGVRLPALFHIGLGAGVIHPGLVERIDFYPGAAPARFGGVAGATLAAETRAPAARARAELGLRLIDSGGLVETPFANGRGSVLVAGRYGYPGPILSALSDVRLSYWDYQSRATWQLGRHDTIGLFAFGGHDSLAQIEDSEPVEQLALDFHRIDLRHDHTWTDGRARVGATVGADRQGSNPIYLTDRLAALRLEVEQQASRSLRLRGGATLQLDDYGVQREEPADPEERQVPSSVEPPPTNVALAAHADGIWQIAPRAEVIAGIRVPVFDSIREGPAPGAGRVRTTIPAVEPRLATRLGIAPRVAWLSTLGVAHQLPVLRVGELPVVVAGGAGFAPGRAELQRTVHQSQGVEIGLPEAFVLTLSGFLSTFSGLTDLTASCVQIEPPSAPAGEGPPDLGPYFCPSNDPVGGHAYGMELSVRRSLSERLAGWISYTLSRSVRDARFLQPDGSTRVETVPSEFDRTHVLNVVLKVDLGRRWRAGTRGVLYSGVPYSRLSGSLPVPPYHALRDPIFFRTDFRLEKRWPIAESGFIAFVFEVQNATLSTEANTLGMDCEADVVSGTVTTRCERGTVGPIVLPSLGVEAVF